MSLDKLPPENQKELVEKMRKYVQVDEVTVTINFLEWLKPERKKREVWIDEEKRNLFKKLLGEGYVEERYVGYAEGYDCHVTNKGLEYLRKQTANDDQSEAIAQELDFLSKDRIKLLEENEGLKKEIKSLKDNPIKVEIPVAKTVFEPIVLKNCGKVGYRWYSAKQKKYLSKDTVGLDADPKVLEGEEE